MHSIVPRKTSVNDIYLSTRCLEVETSFDARGAWTPIYSSSCKPTSDLTSVLEFIAALHGRVVLRVHT